MLTPKVNARVGTASRVGPGDLVEPRDVEGPPAGGKVRLLDAHGALLGLADRTPGGALHPVLVLV